MARKRKKAYRPNEAACEVTEFSEDTVCRLCHRGQTDDVLQSGKLYELREKESNKKSRGRSRLISGYYHNFCLLFSSESVQRGMDDEGVKGFLPEDIRSEVERGTDLICVYCRRNGATIACVKCRAGFHFSCGALASPACVFHFFEHMDTFCHRHAYRQKQEDLASLLGTSGGDKECLICQEKLAVAGVAPENIVAPCCGHILHRDCVQRMAVAAGKATFSCPLCKNREKFVGQVQRLGVYVPHSDAEWEMPGNSSFYRFSEMDGGPMATRCEALECLCPQGRDADRDGCNMYELFRCSRCGSTASHIRCGGLDPACPQFICSVCDRRHEEEEASGSDDEVEVVGTVDRTVERRAEISRQVDKIKQILSGASVARGGGGRILPTGCSDSVKLPVVEVMKRSCSGSFVLKKTARKQMADLMTLSDDSSESEASDEPLRHADEDSLDGRDDVLTSEDELEVVYDKNEAVRKKVEDIASVLKSLQDIK